MTMKPSELKTTKASEFVMYETPDGQRFTYNSKMKRLTVDGNFSLSANPETKTEAKKMVIQYAKHGNFEI